MNAVFSHLVTASAIIQESEEDASQVPVTCLHIAEKKFNKTAVKVKHLCRWAMSMWGLLKISRHLNTVK